MKKTFITLLLMLVCYLTYSQKTETFNLYKQYQDTIPVYMMVSYLPTEDHLSSQVFVIKGYGYYKKNSSIMSYLDFDNQELHKNLRVWLSVHCK